MSCNINTIISKQQLLKYLDTKPEQIALFYFNQFNDSTRTLVCLLYDNEFYYEYVANVQINHAVAITNIKSEQFNVSSYDFSYYNRYQLLIDRYQLYQNSNLSSINSKLSFDIFTSYNINPECINLLVDDFNFYKSQLNDMDYILLFNIYLGINGLMTGYRDAINLLRNYGINEQTDVENFYSKLWDYYNSTDVLRAQIIEYIDNIIKD
jgi:hypothetical protein